LHSLPATPHERALSKEASSLEVPGLDLQDAAAGVVGDAGANANGDSVVEVVVRGGARLVLEAQVQLTRGRGGALRAHVDQSAVVRLEAVAGVRVERARRRVQDAPVGAQVQDGACVKVSSGTWWEWSSYR
jgi:hypothetical protein